MSSGDGRLPAEQVEGLAEAIAAAIADQPMRALVPWTDVVDGVPALMFDDNDNLMLTEVTL